jgi:hypothetical protein
MKLEFGLRKKTDFGLIVEVKFYGAYEQGNPAALKEICDKLELAIRDCQPSALILNLLDFDYIYGDDLYALATTAAHIKGSRKRRPFEVVAEGRKVASWRACHDYKSALELLEQALRWRSQEPEGEPPVYFPEKIFYPDKMADNFMSFLLSEPLWWMQEPSLLDFIQNRLYHGYRFLWLREWHKPIGVRLEANPSSSGFLTVKMTSRSSHHYPYQLELNKSLEVPGCSVDMFLKHLRKADYWRMATISEEHGCGGAYWIIEGVKKQKYHIVQRWCPKPGYFRKAALYLIELSGLEVKEIY